MKKGICPVCNGTVRKACPDNLREYGVNHGWYGYRAEDDTIPCDNCGGQYQFSKPTGEVPLREDGTACVHEYKGENAGRCYTRYTCKHCSDVYHIDSGD